MDFKIEKARTSEIPRIRRFLAASWRESYKDILPEKIIENAITVWQTAEKISGQITKDGRYFALAKDKRGKILGLITARLRKDGDIYVSRLYVGSKYQGNGIGTALLDQLKTVFPAIKKIRLYVDAGNAKARTYYLKYGFIETGTKERIVLDYVKKLVVMEKTL